MTHYNTKFCKSQSPIKNEMRKIVIEALVVNELIEIIPKFRYDHLTKFPSYQLCNAYIYFLLAGCVS